MASTLRTIAICGVLGLAGGVTGLAPAASAPAASTGVESLGSATAQVLHIVTGHPLAGMPVHVTRIDPPEGGGGGTLVFMTGRDGRALMTPLDDGQYEVHVDYNNNRSNSEFFVIDGTTDYHPFVTLYFNPDID
jgi:hypothetical protein